MPASGAIVGPVRLFLRLSFGLTWGVGLVMLLVPERTGTEWLRQALWRVAVAAPSIAGFVAAGSLGRSAFADYVKRVFSVRGSWPWIVIAPLFFFALHATAAAAAGSSFTSLGLAALGSSLLASALADPGPLEEFGWRGFLQPVLQNRFDPVTASAIVGVVWGLWHLPVLVIPGFPQHDSDLSLALVILRFIAQTTALAVLMGQFLNAVRGGVWCAIACHWAANTGALGLVWRFDATAWTLALVAAAVAVALMQRAGLMPTAKPVVQPLV